MKKNKYKAIKEIEIFKFDNSKNIDKNYKILNKKHESNIDKKLNNNIEKFNNYIFIVKRKDYIPVEQPLKIYINDYLYSITMRTPDIDEDFDFVYGYLFTEGIIFSKDDIKQIEFCKNENNRINVYISKQRLRNIKLIDNFSFNKSSCGVCGRVEIDSIISNLSKVSCNLKVNTKDLYRMEKIFEKHQKLFEITGSVHSSAIFDRNFNLVSFSEDIGRHNSLDKTIGKLVKKGLLKNYNKEKLHPLEKKEIDFESEKKRQKSGFILFLSSRVSFEMVTKSIMANIEIIVAISSVTSSAYDLAEKYGITLIGFFRGKRFNIYTGINRISFDK